MKQFFKFSAMVAIVGMLASCSDKKEETPVLVEPKPSQEVVYQPVHQSFDVDLAKSRKYTYYAAPAATAATSVTVDYDAKTPYASPIVVKFGYANGDTYTYTVPATFGLWKNSAGRFRVITDDKCTVWLQGQTKSGKFREFVFYGDPQFTGKKIKPNSYRNLPAGEIVYRK